jgi:hypothetical protein
MTNKTINPDYVCAHCGVPLRWRENIIDWRHIGNRFVKGCDQPPKPVPRVLYDLEAARKGRRP